MIMEQVNLPRLSPSCRTVFAALSALKISTQTAIAAETGLPTRTVQLALKNLIALKLVNVRICLNDTRRKFYCYSKSS
jgi:DNA-binding MarR family transcriptional regulator